MNQIYVENCGVILNERQAEIVVGDDLKHEQMAMIAHSTLEAYRQELGEPVYGPWAGLEDWCMAGKTKWVSTVRSHPDITAEIGHDVWFSFYSNSGWKYGPEKDMENKWHPCLLPWDLLSPQQQLKDEIIISTVRMLSRAEIPQRKMVFSESLAETVNRLCDNYHKSHDELIREALRAWEIMKQMAH